MVFGGCGTNQAVRSSGGIFSSEHPQTFLLELWSLEPKLLRVSVCE